MPSDQALDDAKRHVVAAYALTFSFRQLPLDLSHTAFSDNELAKILLVTTEDLSDLYHLGILEHTAQEPLGCTRKPSYWDVITAQTTLSLMATGHSFEFSRSLAFEIVDCLSALQEFGAIDSFLSMVQLTEQICSCISCHLATGDAPYLKYDATLLAKKLAIDILFVHSRCEASTQARHKPERMCEFFH